MFSLGIGELILLLAVTLVILGPEKLPILAKDIVRFIHYLRAIRDDIQKKITPSLENKDNTSQTDPLSPKDS